MRQNFGDMWLCFVSLFRVATLDNWATILYIAMYGCDNYGCAVSPARERAAPATEGLRPSRAAAGRAAPSNAPLFYAGSYDDRDCKNSINGDLGTPSPGAWTRGHGTPNPQPYFAIVFFVVFAIIAALILLSMFIGTKEMI